MPTRTIRRNISFDNEAWRVLEELRKEHLGNRSMTLSILLLEEAKRRGMKEKKARK